MNHDALHRPSPSTRASYAHGWRVLWCVCLPLALLLSGVLLAAFLGVRMVDARTQERLVVHQTLEADLWARMLTARMEAHQRLLASIAEGVHTSLLEQPAVLAALMQRDGSMLRLLESLHVALPSGAVTHYGKVGVVTDIDPQGLDALRRTITEGKPFITHVPALEDVPHLHVLLSVPMRSEKGQVAGALAAMVKLPVAGLMPEEDAPAQHVQYMLLDGDGAVLAHSDVTQRGRHISSLVAGHVQAWQALSNPSAVHADTEQWGSLLVSRVGLPLPQWQVVVLRDTSADLLTAQGLPSYVGLGLAGGLVLLGLLAAALLWGWLLPFTASAGAQSGSDSGSDAEWGDAVSAAHGALNHDPALRLPLSAGVMAMCEAVPAALLLEHEGRITLATPQVSVMLGYFGDDMAQATIALWLENTATLAQVRHSLVDLGSFEGPLQLRKKDGDLVLVEALVWVPDPLSAATLWRFQLPWRQRRSMPLPENPHAWRDDLTGLPNREAFMWVLQSWVSDSLQSNKSEAETEEGATHAQRMPPQGCMLFVDLDHLGMANETMSRAMGNIMLRHVARLVVSYTQSLGHVARLGGDEFAVLLPGISLAHAQGVAQALCDAMWRWQPSWRGERHWVSISVGVVAMDAQRHTPQQAVRAADMACYEAKRRGRCQVAVGQITAQFVVEASSVR